MKLSEVVKLVGGVLENASDDPDISGVASLRDALPGDLSFLSNVKYAAQLPTTKATAVLVDPEHDCNGVAAKVIRVASPDKAFAMVAPHFTPPEIVRKPGVHPTAVVGGGAKLGANVHIGPYAVIGDGAVIGDRCVIEAHVTIGEECVIGSDSHFYPQCSIRERCKIGNRVIIYSGAVIGSDGFGYTTEVQPDGSVKVEKIPQVGIVELCDDVEIGANTTVDRARFGVTKIGRMTKIDNLVQIGHNVQIGEYCGIVAHVGISGSTHIGNGVMIWGQAGLAGHLNIGDRVEILAQSGVHRDLEANGIFLGTPAVDRREAMRHFHMPKSVERLKEEVNQLKEKIAELEGRCE